VLDRKTGWYCSQALVDRVSENHSRYIWAAKYLLGDRPRGGKIARQILREANWIRAGTGGCPILCW
jgi:hypothetical protein